ncbi:hypothetical protein E2986_13475 [Frieseomelitta varia]|uniref:NTF2 domain-containing protein n=1 Tax=Frieseomelitta varia TaxID=561572 RepID=A0A833R6X4_9HYME|nr:hypothetical protein E2986_13475 [Frieseomelitta varia]
MVETLRILKLKLLKLKILHIGDNEVKDIEEIDATKDLELKELKLAGNPICNDYQTLIKDVQKRCPELLRLDGMDLQKPILSDAVDAGKIMPASERMLAANAQAQRIANQFLEQYFLIFDSDKRGSLLSAYTRDACLTVFDRHHNSNPNILNGYLMDDRRRNTKKRQKLLKQRRLQIVTYLSEMPRTSPMSTRLRQTSVRLRKQ